MDQLEKRVTEMDTLKYIASKLEIFRKELLLSAWFEPGSTVYEADDGLLMRQLVL